MNEINVPLPKPFWESKTLIFNILTAVVTLVGLITDAKIIPPDWMPYILIGYAFVNYVLRTYFTTTSIGNPLEDKNQIHKHPSNND